jgi:hypothetical protein
MPGLVRRLVGTDITSAIGKHGGGVSVYLKQGR